MLLQVSIVTKASTTDVTLERLFARMCSLVTVVSTATAEKLLTMTTLPLSFTSKRLLKLQCKKKTALGYVGIAMVFALFLEAYIDSILIVL